MQQRLRSGALNPANWYLTLGLGLLGASLWLPWWTAQRTARIERRADQICQLLLEAASDLLVPIDDTTVEFVFARLQAGTEAEGVQVADLERQEPLPGALLTLRNKHFLFGLFPAEPEPNQRIGAGSVPALEVYAWPASRLGPGHSAFFAAEDAPRAFTRNLARDYHGAKVAPARSSGQRPVRGQDLGGSYRGLDDERWLLH